MTDIPKSRKAVAKVRVPTVSRSQDTSLEVFTSGLRQRLKVISFRQYVRDVGQGIAKLISIFCILLVFQCLADWWFDLPKIARCFFLIADIAILAWVYRSQLHKSLNSWLSVSHAALMVERKWPHLKQSLISAIQISDGGYYSTHGSRELTSVLFKIANANTTKLDFKTVVPLKSLIRWVGIAILVAGVSAGLAIGSWPASGMLLERLVLMNVSLPTKTIVVAISHDMSLPIGGDAVLSASAEGYIPSSGRVSVTYKGAESQEFPVTASLDKPVTFSLTIHNIQNEFTYTFYLYDGKGEQFTVSPKIPPVTEGLKCVQVPPDYTHLPSKDVSPTDLSLLVGSHLKIHAQSTNSLKSVTVMVQGAKPQSVPATISSTDPKQFEADMPFSNIGVTGFSIHLVDSSDVESVNDTLYTITPVPDNPPEIMVSAPVEDRMTITMRGKPVIDFKAKDDFGLVGLQLKYRVVAAKPVDGQTPVVKSLPISLNTTGQYEYALDLSKVTGIEEGGSVVYWIEGTDNNTFNGPGVTDTPEKQFNIVSSDDKQNELFEKFRQEADELQGLSDSQKALNDSVRESVPK